MTGTRTDRHRHAPRPSQGGLQRGEHHCAILSVVADEPLTAVIGSNDPLDRAAVRQVLERHGVAVMGEGATSIEVLRLVDYHHPSLVVLEHELPGTTGLEAARELLATNPAPVVILISADPHHLSPSATAAGVQAVVPHRDLDALEGAIAGAVERLRTGERRSGRDRRSGVDRRQQQDWSKVWSQRRSGVERRQVLRRAADREAAEAAGSAAGDPPAEPESRSGS